jgi:hypothetical protein
MVGVGQARRGLRPVRVIRAILDWFLNLFRKTPKSARPSPLKEFDIHG